MTARLDDWESLSTAWRAPGADEPLAIDRLRLTVHRRQRGLMLLVVGELVVTLAVVGLVARTLRGGVTRATLTIAALVFLVTVIVWGFTIWNRRGIWRPLAETTREYLRLSRQRVAAGRRTVNFVRASVSVYTLAYGVWFMVRRSRHSPDAEEQMLWLFAVVYCALLVAWSFWYARRLAQDLERIESIERTLGD